MLAEIGLQNIAFAFLGSILPALLWLFFWLKKDTHPEPKKMIALSFIAGMLSVIVVIPIQLGYKGILGGATLVVFWAGTEEVLKYLAAWFFGLRTKYLDEPIDALIYLITAALGFVAMENTLFLLDPLSKHDIIQTIITGNVRFFGTTLVHILASAIIGTAIAYSMRKPYFLKVVNIFLGLVLATALHSLFNLFIMDGSPVVIVLIFIAIWIALFGLLYLFKKIKRLKQV
jgi:RsiW-degrading membrane proteinase PrsW (M82 family)